LASAFIDFASPEEIEATPTPRAPRQGNCKYRADHQRAAPAATLMAGAGAVANKVAPPPRPREIGGRRLTAFK